MKNSTMEHRLLAFILLVVFASIIIFSLLEEEHSPHTAESYPVNPSYFQTPIAMVSSASISPSFSNSFSPSPSEEA